MPYRVGKYDCARWALEFKRVRVLQRGGGTALFLRGRTGYGRKDTETPRRNWPVDGSPGDRPGCPETKEDLSQFMDTLPGLALFNS